MAHLTVGAHITRLAQYAFEWNEVEFNYHAWNLHLLNVKVKVNSTTKNFDSFLAGWKADQQIFRLMYRLLLLEPCWDNFGKRYEKAK